MDAFDELGIALHAITNTKANLRYPQDDTSWGGSQKTALWMPFLSGLFHPSSSQSTNSRDILLAIDLKGHLLHVRSTKKSLKTLWINISHLHRNSVCACATQKKKKGGHQPLTVLPRNINGWNLQPSPMKRKENDLNLSPPWGHGIQPFIFRGVLLMVKIRPTCWRNGSLSHF